MGLHRPALTPPSTAETDGRQGRVPSRRVHEAQLGGQNNYIENCFTTADRELAPWRSAVRCRKQAGIVHRRYTTDAAGDLIEPPRENVFGALLYQIRQSGFCHPIKKDL